jgi:hypothetical protein
MKFPCPHCRKEIDLMEMLQDNDLLAIIKMLNSFGKNSSLVAAYTELFGLRPLKAHTKKWRLLLEEMKRLFDSESFTYQKRTYAISPAGIAEALSLVVHRNFTDHLDTHNYLKRCMITIADREVQGESRQAERDLRRREDALQAGDRDNTGVRTKGGQISNLSPEEFPPLHMKDVPPAHLTDEQIEANSLRVKEMIERIG